MTTTLPGWTEALFDDAAVFPPGLASVPDAYAWHRDHHAAAYGSAVGPLVLGGAHIDAFVALAPTAVDVSIAGRLSDLPAALRTLDALSHVSVSAVEVRLPDGVALEAAFSELAHSVEGRRVDVYVEVPRDHSAEAVLARTARAGYSAKHRTGGVQADLYPSEAELARSIVRTVRAGCAFKATAGLHHAVRNTDPETGFEQHGIVNLLLATEAALRGADVDEVTAILARRDAPALAAEASGLDASLRHTLRGIGTCSVSEPLSDLAALGIVPAGVVEASVSNER